MLLRTLSMPAHAALPTTVAVRVALPQALPAKQLAGCMVLTAVLPESEQRGLPAGDRVLPIEGRDAEVYTSLTEVSVAVLLADGLHSLSGDGTVSSDWPR